MDCKDGPYRTPAKVEAEAERTDLDWADQVARDIAFVIAGIALIGLACGALTVALVWELQLCMGWW